MDPSRNRLFHQRNPKPCNLPRSGQLNLNPRCALVDHLIRSGKPLQMLEMWAAEVMTFGEDPTQRSETA